MTKYCFCPFCQMPLAYLKNDRKGRPYSCCESCGMRVFLKSQRAYEGFLKMSERVRSESGPEIVKLLADRISTINSQEEKLTTSVPAEVSHERKTEPI